MKARGYKDLLVWQKGVRLTIQIYELTKDFPSEERFGLISQMRRAAVSIPSNIAEGQARRTTGEFVQFLSHAEGSLAELETQILVSVELRLCRSSETKETLDVVDEMRRMLNALRRELLRKTSR